MTLNDLIAKYNELAAAQGLPTRKGFDNKAKAEAAVAQLQLGAKVKIAKVKRAVRQHEKGPRGFKFGPVWMSSIRLGRGVAMKPQNMPKLIETARHFGVKVTKDLNQAEVTAAIAKAI
jgi:hypothetical protein